MIKKIYYWFLSHFFKNAKNWQGWDMDLTQGEIFYTTWKDHPILGYFLKYDPLVKETASAPMFSGYQTIEELNQNKNYTESFGGLL